MINVRNEDDDCQLYKVTTTAPDIKCVADGPFSPQEALGDDLDCAAAAGEINPYEEHSAVPDQSCLDQASDSSTCLRLVHDTLYSDFVSDLAPQPGPELLPHLHLSDGAGQLHGH